MTRDRLGAHRYGLSAETRAMLWLTLKGYRVLARRFSGTGGEIDLIVSRGSVIAFVEVKARDSLDDAMSSITHAKRRRISRAAANWLARNQWAGGRTLRGDAVFIARGRLPRHREAAFELEF